MRVFVAIPGITGYQGEKDLDTSKRVNGMYYKGKGEGNMTPCAYCYRIEHKLDVQKAFAEMLKEEQDMKDRHYKHLIELRNKYGV
jgi:hypothetical protein